MPNIKQTLSIWELTIKGNNMVKIRKIKMEKKIPVYDITVKNTHNFFANDVLVHNCAEIELPTNEERTFVCCLSSLNLEKYDEWKETTIVRDLIRMLDNIITYFVDNAPDVIEKARFSAYSERALGLGVMGFHNLLMKNMIPFESMQAKELNLNLFKFIENEARHESYELGRQLGEAPDIQTNLVFDFGGEQLKINSSEIIGSKRAFEYKVGEVISSYGTIISIEGLHDYSGRRNTQLMALAPTANSAILCGTSPSIEPINSNAYIHQTRAGSWPIKNVYLEQFLEEKGYNNELVWKNIISNKGSVQHLGFLTKDEKKVFKTAIELNQMWVVEHASIRQPYISQGQSINLFFPSKCPRDYFNKVHVAAWKKGLKSLYYVRTMASNRPDSVSTKVERVALKDGDSGECLACQG